MIDDLDQRIKHVFAAALRVPAESLHDGVVRGDLEEWDSLGHLAVLERLSAEFQVEIAPERAIRLESIGDIKDFLRQRLG